MLDEQNVSEQFITKMRWIVISALPLLALFSNLSLRLFTWLMIGLTIIYNLTLQFGFFKIRDNHITNYLFSLVDTLFISLIVFYSGGFESNAYPFYFFAIAASVMRSGLKGYYSQIIFISLTYTITCYQSFNYFGDFLSFSDLFLRLTLMFIIGYTLTYFIKTERLRRIENNQLFLELQKAYQQLSEYNAQVEIMATTDTITGLYNYRYFTKQLSNELEKAKANSELVSLVMIDIDHFKDFNDRYGHPSGDLALKELSVILKNNVREQDIVARYGGEEFFVLLPDTDFKKAYACAERIRSAVKNHQIVLDNKQAVNITISGGVACFPINADNAEELLKMADEVLYQAKHKGRDKIHYSL